MSSWYLFPCKCGKSVRVLPKHAGESRKCSECDDVLLIPTMREIRQLESVADTESATESSKTTSGAHWHPALGAMFVTGIPIFLIGLGLAAYSFWMSAGITDRATEKPSIDAVLQVAPEIFQADFDTMSLQFSVDEIWKPLSKNPDLPEYIEPPHLFWRGVKGEYVRWATWASVAAVVGLVMSVIPLMAGGKKK